MALSSCLLPGGKLIVAVQTLFFICSLRCRYSIRQAIAHTIYSAYDVIAYTVYCAMDGCNTLAITHNPEAAGSSPVPATMFNRWFRRKSAVFLYFWRDTDKRSGPNCTPTGCKIGGNGFCGDCRICTDILYLNGLWDIIFVGDIYDLYVISVHRKYRDMRGS